MARLKIGEFLVQKGLLKDSQIPHVLENSRHSGLRFGESAIALGFLNENKLLKVLGPGYRVDFFYLDPRYFPRSTMHLFDKAHMIRLGFLPLGTKTDGGWFGLRKKLNIGMLSPANKAYRDEIELLFEPLKKGNEFDRIVPYLILGDQFLKILETVYDISHDELKLVPEEHRNETLSMYL